MISINKRNIIIYFIFPLVVFNFFMVTVLVERFKNLHKSELDDIFQKKSEYCKYLGYAQRFSALANENDSNTIRNIHESIVEYYIDLKEALDKLKKS